MQYHRPHQKGFAAVEAVLLVVILLIAGVTGYYVWHANKQTSQILNSAAKDANSSPAKNTKKTTSMSVGKTSNRNSSNAVTYFTIKEWSVKAPYSGSQHLEYAITDFGKGVYAADFTSSELMAQYGNQCQTGGGVIEKSSGNTAIDEAGTTPEQSAAHNNQPYTTKKIGDYYYTYMHPQDSCSGDNSQATELDESVKALVPVLVAE